MCLLIHTKYVSLKKTLIEEEDLNTNKVSFQPVFLNYNCLTWVVETGSVMIAEHYMVILFLFKPFILIILF